MEEQKKNEGQIPLQDTPPIRPAEVPKEVQQEPRQIAQPAQAYVPRTTIATEDLKPSRWQKFKAFLVECQRVLRVTKKPSREEFKTIVKISAIGMAIIGFLGFFVHFVKELIF
jgi:protein transport protein SEC61 subunit gamma-like protein